MQSSVTMLKRAAPLACASLLAAGSAQAALQDRDLNGETVIDAFYDTDLDITWLRDANVGGAMDWDTAVGWASGFSIGGHGGWRLPTVNDTCDEPCMTGGLGHLWYVELGNTHGSSTHAGGFQNFSNDRLFYWSATELDPGNAFMFDFSTGERAVAGKFNSFYAMAVTNGDVGMIPEPGTCALMLVGLAGLAAAARRCRPH